MRLRKTYHDMLLVALLSVTCLASCTKVKYGAVEKEAPYTDVSFNMAWNEENGRIPEKTALIMGRIRNTIHYGWLADPKGNLTDFCGAEEVLPEEEPATKVSGNLEEGGETPLEPDVPAEPEVDPNMKRVDNGEYYIMSVEYDKARLNMPDLDRFTEDPSISMKSLKAYLPEKSFQDIQEEIGAEIVDFNPGIDFVENVGPILVSVQKESIYPHNETLIEVRPEYLTQRFDFRIKMDVEEGVEPIAVYGDLSGVPSSAHVMATEICDSTFSRVMFRYKVTPEGDPVTEGSVRYIPYVCEGHVDVFALLPPRNNDFLIGPGILQMTIFAGLKDASADAEGVEGNNQRMKTFRAGINLREYLLAADMLESVRKEGKHTVFHQKGKIASIDIRSKLKIRKDQILAEDGGQGLNEWITDPDWIVDDEDTEL